jgi:hypothetical protein
MRALAFWSMTRCIFEYPQPKINIRRNPGLHETSKVDKPYAGLIQATAASPCLSVSNGICQLCLILPRCHDFCGAKTRCQALPLHIWKYAEYDVLGPT